MRNTLLTLSALILVLVAFANSAQAGTVSGEVRYTDKVPTTSGFGDTRYLPVPYARIELYRKTGPEVTDAIMISSDNLGADGTFSFTVSNSLLGGNSDFQLRVYPDCDGGSTQPVRVLELDGVSVPVIFQGAAMVTDAAGDWTGVAGDIDTPSTLTVSEDNSGPFNIMFCISRAAERVALMEGGTFPDRVTVYWEPGSTTGTYTESTSQSIYLLGNPTSDTDEFDDDVIVHEYGHFISYNYTQEDSPGGYHYGEEETCALRGQRPGPATSRPG
ncbi:MAG: hypothetical protein U5N86_00180 [Planctomycetota bacterium]|nr:hypothetical protein [Planctomycetota bacterium]